MGSPSRRRDSPMRPGGVGPNTALSDAAALSDLLDEFEDDLDKVLPPREGPRGWVLAGVVFHKRIGGRCYGW